MTAPGRVEVLRQGLAAAAEEMGEVLARGAFSANIKERRDHSCAVFTADGQAVAQAAHIPVHLGAMPASVASVLDELGALAPGDVALVNDPAHGGTHLPDLTMVAPVHHGGQRVAHVAARAHHADVGGTAPGSMPAHASRLAEEGLVLAPVRLLEAGAWNEPLLEQILESTRSPEERRGDLAAQRGALEVGIRRVRELAQRHGAQALAARMEELLDHTESVFRARLAKAPAGTYPGQALLEDGNGDQHRLVVEVTLTDGQIALDYTGTAPQVAGNLNAPLPVTRAGALYVARLLLGPELPANAGLERCLTLHVPAGTLLNPEPGAAVAAGNVETSQRNVDLLLTALQPAFPEATPAQSQGTMNNVTLGGQGTRGVPFTYYETLGGGEGATPTRGGMSGRHTHMTNTRNTPVETLEHDLPLRVRRLTLRRGSGGAGRHTGGDGLHRELEALVDGIEVNLLSTRRTHPPEGLAGGHPGTPGRNIVFRADGTTEHLGGIAQVTLDRGDVLSIETPGGGGWGAP